MTDIAISCETGRIHGDLNSNNILVAPSDTEIALIDFALMREDLPVLTDIAKLEVDLVFSVLDNSSAEVVDPDSVANWRVISLIF
ncbi:unnamed protein product, partial [marine sediment metagenome]